MRRDNLNRNAFKNINISEEMVDSLIADLKAGRRHSDIRFRHSTAIMSLAIAGAVGFSSIGVGAAYLTYQSRVQNMPEQEQADYVEEVAADTYEITDDSRTRSLSNVEYARYLELEDAYYENSVFPKEILKHVATLDEVADDELAFVEEINKIRIPEGELTDEQLLQLIDHEAKYLYTIEQNVAKEASVVSQTDESVVTSETEAVEKAIQDRTLITEVTAQEEQAIKKKSFDLVKAIYGVDIDDTWNFDVYGFEWTGSEGLDLSVFEGEWADVEVADDPWAGYEVTITESDAPNCTMYQISIPKTEDGEYSISCSGKKYFANQTEYTNEQAKAFEDEGKQIVLDFVKETFGMGTPDKVKVAKSYNLLGEEVTSSEIAYVLYYGDDSVSVYWNINNKQIYGVSGKNLIIK